MAAARMPPRLLGLDERVAHNALSIAATEAAGQRVQFGAMTKSLHTGNAAANGVLAALLAGKGHTASHRQFTDEKVNRPDVKELRDRILVVEDHSLRQTEAKATVTLDSGETSTEHVRHATGTPENPISDEELREKFADLVEPELGEGAAWHVVSLVDGLPESESLQPLLDVLVPAAEVSRKR